MDTECNMSIEDQVIIGFDYRPWHLMVKEETANVSTEVEGDLQKPDEKTAPTISGEGENYFVVGAKVYPVLIDFEKICLGWNHDGGDLKLGIRMEDPNYMKKKLMEWVQSVVAYIRFLHASAGNKQYQ